MLNLTATKRCRAARRLLGCVLAVVTMMTACSAAPEVAAIPTPQPTATAEAAPIAEATPTATATVLATESAGQETEGIDEPGGLFAQRFELLGGGQLQLQEFDGTPVVVHIFASWCTPCIAHLPVFQDAHALYADRVQIVGLNADETDVQAMTELIENSGVSYPIALGGTQEQLAELGVLAMPTTLFFYPDGSNCMLWSGAITETNLMDRIERCLQR